MPSTEGGTCRPQGAPVRRPGPVVRSAARARRSQIAAGLPVDDAGACAAVVLAHRERAPEDAAGRRIGGEMLCGIAKENTRPLAETLRNFTSAKLTDI